MKMKSLQSILCALVEKTSKEAKQYEPNLSIKQREKNEEERSMDLGTENNRKINWTKSRLSVSIKNINRLLSSTTNRMRHDILLVSRRNSCYHHKSSNINLSNKGWGDRQLSVSDPHKIPGSDGGLLVIQVLQEAETEDSWGNLPSKTSRIDKHLIP